MYKTLHFFRQTPPILQTLFRQHHVPKSQAQSKSGKNSATGQK